MSTKTLVWVLFIFLSLTWGSSFILMKKSMFPAGDEVMVLGPFQVGALRITIAGLVLLPFAIKFKKYLTRKTIPILFVTGFFGNLIPAMMFTLAETNINSSLAGLVNMSTSFFVVLIGVVFYKSKPSLIQLIGLGIGSAGLFFVLNSQSDVGMNKDIRYALFLFPATIGYAISLTTIKFKLSNMPSVAITSLSFLLILPFAIILAILTGAFNSVLTEPDGFKALGYLSILAVVGTAIAVMLFTRLIAISNHIFSSAIAYMLPVVAIFIGLLDGELFPLKMPNTCHVVGLFLKKLHGIPWVADFRDAWTLNPFIDYTEKPLYRIEDWLERQVIDNADYMTAINHHITNDYVQKYSYKDPARFIPIPHAYDDEDFARSTEKKKRPGKIRIVYTGSLYGRRKPDKFLEALKQLNSSIKNLHDKLEVQFFGNVGTVPDLARSLGISQLVSCREQVSHTEVFNILMDASVLLIIIGEGPNAKSISTGKIFEYIGSGTPIMAIIPEGVTANMIRKTGTGRVIKPDVEQITQTLADIVKHGTIPDLNPNVEEIDSLSFKHASEKFVEVFNTAIGEK